MGFVEPAAPALGNKQAGDGGNRKGQRRGERQGDDGDSRKTQDRDEDQSVSNRAKKMAGALLLRPLRAISPRFRLHKRHVTANA